MGIYAPNEPRISYLAACIQKLLLTLHLLSLWPVKEAKKFSAHLFSHTVKVMMLTHTKGSNMHDSRISCSIVHCELMLIAAGIFCVAAMWNSPWMMNAGCVCLANPAWIMSPGEHWAQKGAGWIPTGLLKSSALCQCFIRVFICSAIETVLFVCTFRTKQITVMTQTMM